MYLDAVVRFGPNNAKQMRLITAPNANVDRIWSYSWNPAGGVLGGGRLSATVSGADGGSAFVDLTPAELAQAPSFNAFGLYAPTSGPLTGNPNQPTWFVEAYIDNLNYVTAVPEPGSLLLLAVATAGAVASRVRRRNRSNPR